MKSQVNVAVTATVGLLVVIGVSSLSLVYQSHAVIKGITERSIVESVNQMELIELGIENSALSSVHQAGYNVSKYATYKFGPYGISNTCDPALLTGMPNNLPYWRVFNDACFDNSTTPPEIEEIVRTQMKQETSENFKIYIDTIKKLYEINIPSYTTDITILDDENISFSISSSGEIKFDSEKLSISIPSKIVRTITLPLRRLIKFGVNNFTSNDTIAPQIELANQSMGSSIINPSSVKPAWDDSDKNNGELSGNCQTTDFEICIHPDDEPPTYPTKPTLFPPAFCEGKFATNVVDNINALDSSTDSTDISVESKTTWVKPTINSNDETKCSTNNTINSTLCDCIEWICPPAEQVLLGDATPTKVLGLKHIVGTDPTQPSFTCTTCYAEIDDDGDGINDICTLYSGKVCPSGIPQNGDCLIQSTPTCPAGMSLNGDTDKCEVAPTCAAGGILNNDTDKCEVAPTCSAGSYDIDEDNCIITDQPEACPPGFSGPCTEEPPIICQCSGSADCPAGILDGGTNTCQSNPICATGTYDTATNTCQSNPTCPAGETYNSTTDQCEKTIPKECPSGTDEYGGTGRCYNNPSCPGGIYNPATDSCQPNPNNVCDLHKNYHTKSCDYNYQANATALIKNKDKINKYSVYDSGEGKTDSRNLELQFYVLSKN